ncbi:MAG: MFS transporter [Planctomycetota bacterium]|jgi:NNP family nitrate/nitrite transporter-like MFS transporter
MPDATAIDTILFVALPYLALTLFFVGTIVRYRKHPFSFSSLSSQFLENRQHFWAQVPFHYGLLVVLAGHLVAFLLPSWILAWNGSPLRLYVLEVTAFVFGILAFVGIINIVIRRFRSPRSRVVTSTADWILYVLLFIQIATGLSIALSYTWGSSWFASILTPYLWSLVRFDPEIAYVVPLPWMVKAHITGLWALLAFFPFTRPGTASGVRRADRRDPPSPRPRNPFMTNDRQPGAVRALVMNTTAFTVCFAAWMMYGVLVTFLVGNGLYRWSASEMGWLIGIPVLTGALFRLPLGVATDKWGGRPVYTLLLLVSAVPMYLVSVCDSYWAFFLAGLGFGFTGTSFAIGIAFTSVWWPQRLQGTALGIFGAGNAGAALTTMLAPSILKNLTDGGANLEGWRTLPKIYAVALVIMGVVFWLMTTNKIPAGSAQKNLRQRLAPLEHTRGWRFGLYYFFVFGGFVALAQWLVPYYVNAYALPLAMAGWLTAVNTLPSGVIRAVGGIMSDKWGARAVMFGVFAVCIACCALLIVPQMDIRSPGSGVMSKFGGTVTSVTEDEIVVVSQTTGEKRYPIKRKAGELVTEEERNKGLLVFPRGQSWQESVVEVGDTVKPKQLLARGVTEIFFQANVWIFTILSFILGAAMGIGKAAVYKHIPDYFPNDVGVVGGIVGVLGGLGGFVCPVIFGYLLEWTGIWTTCWMFFFGLTVVCFLWMHFTVRKLMQRRAPDAVHLIEHGHYVGEEGPPVPEANVG